MDYKQIGLNIALWRKLNGMTQRELAEKIGLDQTHISRYELGKRTPNINTLIKIADALRVDIKILLEI